MRTKVYLAGPISKGDLAHNIEQATTAMRRLMQAGFSVLCPQFSCYLGGPEPTICGGGFTHWEWMEQDMPWVLASDAVLRLPGESLGADNETTWAHNNDIPVYYSVDDLIQDLWEE